LVCTPRWDKTVLNQSGRKIWRAAALFSYSSRTGRCADVEVAAGLLDVLATV
jgi:hypothetical protein